ncbi:MAG: helix-turn-helix domain-containing protein [Caulobacter sp.]|nr:helix-turn-helix domain-containing protein [Caulobacter sp.]
MAKPPVIRKGVPKGDKRQRTRKTLVEAAAAVIAERGFDRTSIEAVCTRANLSRGSFYGNFKSREDLFLAVMDSQWRPIEADFRLGAPLRTQMRILGEAVAAQARERRPMAAGAAAFQLYVLTHPHMTERMTARNAETLAAMAAGFARIAPGGLPMPADRFARVVDALITGLMFTAFQTPDLLSDADIIAAFEALAGPEQPAPSPWTGGHAQTLLRPGR